MALVDSEGNQLYFGSYSLSQVIRLKKRYHLFEALFSCISLSCAGLSTGVRTIWRQVLVRVKLAAGHQHSVVKIFYKPIFVIYDFSQKERYTFP